MALVNQGVTGSTLAGTNDVTIYTVPAASVLYVLRASLSIVGAWVASNSNYMIIWDGGSFRCLSLGGAQAENHMNDEKGFFFPAGTIIKLEYSGYGAGFSYGAFFQGELVS